MVGANEFAAPADEIEMQLQDAEGGILADADVDVSPTEASDGDAGRADEETN